MAPLVWLAGVPWSEAPAAGALMGTKTVLNEFIAYVEMAALPPEALSERSRVIMTYALCGFANFGSLGILVGGLTAMVPERRDEVLALGLALARLGNARDARHGGERRHAALAACRTCRTGCEEHELGEGRLRRETVEGFSLFVGGEARAEGERRP